MAIRPVFAALDFYFFIWFCFLSGLITCSSGQDQVQPTSFVVSTLNYPETELKHFDWRYLRVELPPWFSSVSMDLTTNAQFDKQSLKNHPKSLLPLICFRDGSPPLPDLSNSSLDHSVLDFLLDASIGGRLNLPGMEQCIVFQKSMTVTLTNEQISPGVLYVGFFNGIGYVRTQSKMINRGPTYKVSAKITIKGCTMTTMWGPYCNQTINLLSCAQSDAYKHPRQLLNILHNFYLSSNTGFNFYGNKIKSPPVSGYKESVPEHHMLIETENVICGNSNETACLRNGELKIYSLEVMSMSSHVKIVASSVSLNSSNNSTENVDKVILLCYVRHGTIPSSTVHDYSGDISRFPLIIELPKLGHWYISVIAVNQTKGGVGGNEDVNTRLCFSLELQVHLCPLGRAGENCKWETYMLQRFLKQSLSAPFGSYYLPVDKVGSIESSDFSLEPLLSNSSLANKSEVAWTYFLLDIPHGGAGGNIHLQLKSETKINYELYARYGGIPSTGSWDYLANDLSNDRSSIFVMSNDSSTEKVDFYILYAREGTWSIGVRDSGGSSFKKHSTISFSLEGCPKQCSGHGTCHSAVEESGLTLYSYCSCDRTHGGFDCSIEIISHQGHLWQSISLIGSNAAAVLPAFWVLRQKAFAEWILFTSSGISSALYHSCDVGTWCALSFRVLQFMDFWLSFMAVVSTFIYMATIDEVSKRAIHTGAAILTALMASSGPTRSSNIILVVAIGSLGLLVAWMIEFFSTSRISSYQYPLFNLNLLERWQSTQRWLHNIIGTLRKRFRWNFIILGFMGIAAAATSWKLETSQSYWIWHSVWHVTIYTAAFFFLCATSVKNGYQQHPITEYELTTQNSFTSRGE